MSDPVRMSEEERRRLGDIARAKGLQTAARELEVDRSTLASAIAGLGVRKATITHLRVKLGDARPQL